MLSTGTNEKKEPFLRSPFKEEADSFIRNPTLFAVLPRASPRR